MHEEIAVLSTDEVIKIVRPDKKRSHSKYSELFDSLYDDVIETIARLIFTSKNERLVILLTAGTYGMGKTSILLDTLNSTLNALGYIVVFADSRQQYSMQRKEDGSYGYPTQSDVIERLRHQCIRNAGANQSGEETVLILDELSEEFLSKYDLVDITAALGISKMVLLEAGTHSAISQSQVAQTIHPDHHLLLPDHVPDEVAIEYLREFGVSEDIITHLVSFFSNTVTTRILGKIVERLSVGDDLSFSELIKWCDNQNFTQAFKSRSAEYRRNTHSSI